LLLCNTEYDHDRTRNAVNKLVASRVRGVALATSSLDPALLDPFVSHGIPVVALSRKLARTGGGYLNVDVKTGLESAVAHLLDLGHRSFAAITGPLSVPSARNYAEVLRSVMTEHGLPPCEFLECNYRHEGGMMAVRSLMLRPQLPTAVLCGNDLVALGAISALEQLGVDVPKSVSVVGFDDILFARLARPPLTTVAVPCAEIGRLALETLASPGGRRLRPVAVPTKLVVRSSTAPPRSTGRAPRRAG
jgi:LacI family transcriptional regulator